MHLRGGRETLVGVRCVAVGRDGTWRRGRLRQRQGRRGRVGHVQAGGAGHTHRGRILDEKECVRRSAARRARRPKVGELAGIIRLGSVRQRVAAPAPAQRHTAAAEMPGSLAWGKRGLARTRARVEGLRESRYLSRAIKE